MGTLVLGQINGFVKPILVGNFPYKSDIFDVNGDGYPDVVTCTSWGYDEVVLLGDGRGAFHAVSPPNEIDGDGEPGHFLLRDFNKDGRLDIAVSARVGDGSLRHCESPRPKYVDNTLPVGYMFN